MYNGTYIDFSKGTTITVKEAEYVYLAGRSYNDEGLIGAQLEL